jgi:hypothetical protein
MESRLLNLKNDFNNLINIRNNVKNIFEILQSRIDKLKILYSEFIQNNKNQMFVFGLDSFNFQSKLIDIEYDDMKRLFMAIGNRMYCEYFKLNKIIIEYILNNIKDKKITEIIKVNNYPIYKDLEPFKEYKFETLMDIHENILKMLAILVSELGNKENELTIHKSKQHIGLNIDNFVTTFNFNNSVMRERILMFITYIEFFHKLHTKYLKRFSNKIQLIYTDINNDIKFDESLEINSSNSSDKSSKSNNNNSNNSNNSNNIKIISQYVISESDNESNKSNKNIETITRKNSSSALSETSISSKSDNSISSKSDNSNKNLININSNIIYENIINRKNNSIDKLYENTFIEVDKSISDEEMNEMFLNIESSCDSIINKEVEVINEELTKEMLDSIQNNDEKENIELKLESKDEVPEVIEEVKEEVIEEVKEEVKEEVTEEYNDEIKEEPNITETIESTNTTDIEPEPEPEPEAKKKRTYKPRKKKT